MGQSEGTVMHAMKACEGILTLALDGGEWWFSWPSQSTPGERTPQYPFSRRKHKVYSHQMVMSESNCNAHFHRQSNVT
jgi:hypothetical protein